MKLSVLERIKLFDALPATGDVTTLRIVRRLREALSFSEAEHAKFGIKMDAGQITWQSSEDKEVSMGAKAMEVASAALQSMSDAGTLTLDYFSLCEKFLPETDGTEE